MPSFFLGIVFFGEYEMGEILKIMCWLDLIDGDCEM
jgi:hypothetical protein